MANIVVTGASGQLGSELQDLAASYPQHHFLFCTRTELDINNPESIQTVFKNFKPQFCINCAAYTAVDKAETDPEGAFAANATAVKNLAGACADSNCKFIHISTDYVFNGIGMVPFKEDHPTDPVNLYGKSKLQGEQDAMAVNPQTVIIRTSWVYSVYGANFVKTMIRLMQSRPEISVVADQLGCPTYAADLAEALLQIISSGKWQPGIYHYSNAGIITWHQFAQSIKEGIGATCTVRAISTEEYPTPAKRPAFSVMDTAKIETVYRIRPKPWKESLTHCLAQLQKGS